MLYALLCYNTEDEVCAWSREHEDKVMAGLRAVQDPLVKAGRLGPNLRLMPTTAATTLVKTQDPPLVIDGPYAETKEQLLGFYIADFDNLEAALAFARDLARVNPGGAYEVRPVMMYDAGAPLERSAI